MISELTEKFNNNADNGLIVEVIYQEKNHSLVFKCEDLLLFPVL